MEKSSLSNTALETVQWFVFLLAGIVALPIVIGALFGMNFAEVSGLMQRSFFIVGIASLLQGLFGHRLPIVEGPAGIWISIFAIMASTSMQNGMSSGETLQQLEAMMIVTGIFLFLLGAFKIAGRIVHIFTPLVTGTFFLLLTVQLSGTFLQGMLGINDESSTIQVADAGIAFLTFFLILGLSMMTRSWLSNYAVLIGIVVGWIAYLIFVGTQPSQGNLDVFALPELFAFGLPSFDLSVVPVAFITAILIISNLIAAVVSLNQLLGKDSANRAKEVDRGTAFSGINHALAGIFSAIGNVPLASSSGFVALTGQKEKKPFIYASLVLIIIAFFPPIIAFFSSIPAPIANAALMATFIQLVGLAVRNLALEQLDGKKTTILGIAYLLGMGVMFLPAEAFQKFPAVVQNVLSNGLLLGTILVMLLEQLWKSKKS